MNGIFTAGNTARQALKQLRESMKSLTGADWDGARRWAQDLEEILDTEGRRAEILVIDFKELARRSDELFQAMDFSARKYA